MEEDRREQDGKWTRKENKKDGLGIEITHPILSLESWSAVSNSRLTDFIKKSTQK